MSLELWRPRFWQVHADIDKMLDIFRKEGKTVRVVAGIHRVLLDLAVPSWVTGFACTSCDRRKASSRSLATRGRLGRLSRATQDIVHVMDAMGKDLILVETVGVGKTR